jgi:hypothetical protein
MISRQPQAENNISKSLMLGNPAGLLMVGRFELDLAGRSPLQKSHSFDQSMPELINEFDYVNGTRHSCDGGGGFSTVPLKVVGSSLSHGCGCPKAESD